MVKLAHEFHQIIFEPEITQPLRTLDLPLGGSASPVDALAVLVDFLTVANSKSAVRFDDPMSYDDDETGERTLAVLKGGLKVANRITGNSGESLGLHPFVYFTNDKGKHSRFLFLGMVALITEKLRNNDDGWFKKFTKARSSVEAFLIENKSLVGIILQTLNKAQRTPKMRDLFAFLVSQTIAGKSLVPEDVIGHLGLSVRTYDVTVNTRSSTFSDDTKSKIYYREAIKSALKCPVCDGLLDPGKSVSYDHKTRVRNCGLGSEQNGQMAHPYCNTGVKA